MDTQQLEGKRVHTCAFRMVHYAMLIPTAGSGWKKADKYLVRVAGRWLDSVDRAWCCHGTGRPYMFSVLAFPNVDAIVFWVGWQACATVVDERRAHWCCHANDAFSLELAAVSPHPSTSVGTDAASPPDCKLQIETRM